MNELPLIMLALLVAGLIGMPISLLHRGGVAIAALGMLLAFVAGVSIALGSVWTAGSSDMAKPYPRLALRALLERREVP